MKSDIFRTWLLAISAGVAASGANAQEFSQRHPAWSPDGNSIAYLESSLGTNSIKTIDLTTGIVMLVTGNVSARSGPAFSPDGRKIAFIHSPPDGLASAQLATIDLESREIEILYASDGELMHPQYHPSGEAISYVEIDEGGADIKLFSFFDTFEFSLTDTPGLDEYHPKWKPDGTALVFDRHVPECATERCHQLVELDLEGWAEEILYTVGSNQNVGAPIYTPDASAIAFSMTGGSEAGIWTIGLRIDLFSRLRIDKDGRASGGVVYSPDGTRIAYHANDAGLFNIYIASVDGDQLRQVTGLRR